MYSFTRSKVENESVNVDLQFPPADTDATEYIEYYPERQTYYECVSEERDSLCEILYNNRMSFRSEHDCVSLLKCMVNYLCTANRSVKTYVSENKVFNDVTMKALSFIHRKTREFVGINRDSEYFYGEFIPVGMVRSKVQLIPKYSNRFWKPVMENAFQNAYTKTNTYPFTFDTYE